jgi:translation elongation factor EF-Tu-like GTPase
MPLITSLILLLSVSSTSPPTPAATAFEMTIKDVFSIKGHGPVVTGQITSGRVALGDTVLLVASSDSVRTRVVRIEKFRKSGLKEATVGPGDVGLELADVPAARVQEMVATRVARLISVR